MISFYDILFHISIKSHHLFSSQRPKQMCHHSIFEKTKENKWFFNIFSKILQKPLVLYGFWPLWVQKQRKTNGFSIFSGKYCKNHWFYMVFEHSGCKNKGKPTVFQYFQQTIANTTDFKRFLSTLDAKTKENHWFFNIFNKIMQKRLVL